ncbi:calcium/sodium antiporter [Moraxella haemolytica]|uniref:calcium/sodium antiporter n=1 Tax=Moraxella haemolytica TaxID=2904119 RepID=UPI002542D77A|nr:calcium/sodium antiporter [Moraxella sp. ZY171148]WII95034.1 calcium/sodium antiporter [Moraxella sp. ZY171148]
MLLFLSAVAVGLVLLVFSADAFIDGAVGIATKYHVPKILIGTLIIGVGTSAPEMVVSALSALAGSPGIALGNAYGSNIVNITLVLGITALIAPIVIQKDALKADFPWLIGVTALTVILMIDGHLGRLDAIILLMVLLANIATQIHLTKTHTKAITENSLPTTHKEIEPKEDDELPSPDEIHIGKSLIGLIIGLVVMIASSRLVVWGSVELARLWGLSDLIIGLTIVAIGTSLPELVSSVIAARRDEFDLAFGNVLGSNIFNTLAVVGIAAAIEPMAVNAEILNRDILVMSALTIALFLLSVLALKGNGKIGRGVGIGFITCFIGYSVWLVISATA